MNFLIQIKKNLIINQRSHKTSVQKKKKTHNQKISNKSKKTTTIAIKKTNKTIKLIPKIMKKIKN